MRTRFFFLLLLSIGLVSCGEVARDMGLENVPDIKLREGLTGTKDDPAILDPFKTYNLVMAANECRYFQMKVPQNWYWKIYLTAANRKEGEHSALQAEVGPNDPPWAPCPNVPSARPSNWIERASRRCWV